MSICFVRSESLVAQAVSNMVCAHAANPPPFATFYIHLLGGGHELQEALVQVCPHGVCTRRARLQEHPSMFTKGVGVRCCSTTFRNIAVHGVSMRFASSTFAVAPAPAPAAAAAAAAAAALLLALAPGSGFGFAFGFDETRSFYVHSPPSDMVCAVDRGRLGIFHVHGVCASGDTASGRSS